jgi:hypothetical protein
MHIYSVSVFAAETTNEVFNLGLPCEIIPNGISLPAAEGSFDNDLTDNNRKYFMPGH